MRFSILKTDKDNTQHLTVKPAEWLMEHIQTDTKAGIIGKLRFHIAYNGDDGVFEQKTPIAMIHPSVEMKKTENGNLEIIAFNGLITLHIPNLLSQKDIEAVKEASTQLPMTFAAFMGADGRSVEVLVAVAKNGNVHGNGNVNANLNFNGNELEMDAFCKTAYEQAIGVYSGILPYPIERQAVSARSSFRMTVDPSPYYHPEATPLLISTKTKTITGTGTLTGTSELGLGLALTSTSESGLALTSEITSPDIKLYAVYEQMYKQAAEKAKAETADVIESQRYHAYITELTRLLCEMGVPE